MEERYDVKLEERKRFLKYFRVWMILAGIALVAFCIMRLTHKTEEKTVPTRNNSVAPSQRVYDYADVLTDAEEKKLEELIAQYEEYGTCDLVLVTINQSVGYTDSEWTESMVNIADDFYDQKAFGYDKPHGDGALLLDNWYHAGQDDSEAGAWLSTSGKIEYAIGSYEEEKVFEALDDGFEISAFQGYANALKKVASYGYEESAESSHQLPWLLVLAVPVIVALIYAAKNMKQAPGVDTTSSTTYVPGGQPIMKNQQDQFLRKNVTKVKIETSSSSRSGGGGSYGHHTSSGGFSHGGGGHRR
ncbi:MAG: TPM domain-containing protein [Lachnospiraceae bacterium]|nr:TPM domain-containing protein [Lachnospiraceae bacterium]